MLAWLGLALTYITFFELFLVVRNNPQISFFNVGILTRVGVLTCGIVLALLATAMDERRASVLVVMEECLPRCVPRFH